MSGHEPTGDPRGGSQRAAILNRYECAELLRGNRVGRIGFVNDGWPAILPVNYVMDGDDIVIRTDSGTKFAALRHGAEVSFEADAVDPLYRSGWSVLVYGNAAEIEDLDELERVKSLGLRAWHQGAKPFWIRIAPVLVTGRRLPKAWQYPDRTDS
jgi:nitroimidazol reductase NimA-like FMN-containing flavoprotein (pyridoxamine 5'-phosphate oxidase superfamily)